jgi:hypothetical protein
MIELLPFFLSQLQMTLFQYDLMVSFTYHTPIIVTDLTAPLALALGALCLLVHRAWKDIRSTTTDS